jgi:ATP-citrate lyase beta-subunit
MPRRKLSEYRSKTLVNTAIGEQYIGWPILDSDDLKKVDGFDSYVVKVDQAVKGRFKKGLVLLDIAHKDLKSAAKQLMDEGYSSLLIEPFVEHVNDSERYLALSHGRDGYTFAYSRQGGINVESSADAIEHFTVSDEFNWDELATATNIPAEKLQALLALFKDNHFATLEINPYIADRRSLNILDTAIEVDDAGQYFTRLWNESDIRSPRKLSESEEQIHILNDNSPASFSLSVLNPDGAIFLLLSGGGASIVIADEVYNVGLGNQLANYGEYSGNPNTEETYIYTKQIIKLIIDSKAPKKILFIGGAVANFTDIAKTFAGIIRALDDSAVAIKKQDLKVFVRRGGPNQEIGLEKIKQALEKHDILGGVYGPDVSISDALGSALEELKGAKD